MPSTAISRGWVKPNPFCSSTSLRVCRDIVRHNTSPPKRSRSNLQAVSSVSHLCSKYNYDRTTIPPQKGALLCRTLVQLIAIRSFVSGHVLSKWFISVSPRFVPSTFIAIFEIRTPISRRLSRACGYSHLSLIPRLKAPEK